MPPLGTCMIFGCPKHGGSVNTRKTWHTKTLAILHENSSPLQSHYSDHKVTSNRQGCKVCPRHRAQVASLLKKNVSGIRFKGDEQARVQAFLDTPVQQATSPAPSVAAMNAARLPLAEMSVEVTLPCAPHPRALCISPTCPRRDRAPALHRHCRPPPRKS